MHSAVDHCTVGLLVIDENDLSSGLSAYSIVMDRMKKAPSELDISAANQQPPPGGAPTDVQVPTAVAPATLTRPEAGESIHGDLT